MATSEPETDKDSRPARAERAEQIRWVVLEECQGHLGGEPHATTLGRHGYRHVPTLCDRCARLTTRLLAIDSRED